MDDEITIGALAEAMATHNPKHRYYAVVGMSESYLEAIARRGWERSLIEARRVLNTLPETGFILRIDAEPIGVMRRVAH